MYIRILKYRLYVSFAKEPYQREHILQTRPMILRSLLTVATTSMRVPQTLTKDVRLIQPPPNIEIVYVLIFIFVYLKETILINKDSRVYSCAFHTPLYSLSQILENIHLNNIAHICSFLYSCSCKRRIKNTKKISNVFFWKKTKTYICWKVKKLSRGVCVCVCV